MTAIRIDAGDRLFIAGQNGSGKSVFASAIANRWDRVLVYDPKVDPVAVLPNSTIAYGVRAALAAIPGRVIYRPTPAESSNPGFAFGKLCRKVYRIGGHGIVIHELADFGSTDRELDPDVSICFRAGRSRYVPMIAVTQRPVNVPRLAKSEASHLACFHLIDPDDRAVMAGYMGQKVRLEPVGRDHSFWYRGPDLELRLMAPLPAPGR